MYEWQTEDHIHTEKNTDWYWIVGIVAFSIFLISVILNDLVFGILVLVGAFAMTLFASRPAETISASIGEKGIQVGKVLYPYENLVSFWIETEDMYPRVLIKSRKFLINFVSILVGEGDPEEIREILSKHLPEEKHSEPLLEKILIRLGF